MKKLFNVRILALCFSLGITLSSAGASSITQTGNPQVTGCPDAFTTSIVGTFYQWNFGSQALPPTASGAADQTANTTFLLPGPQTVYVFVTTSGGIVEDSLTINVVAGSNNVSLSISQDTFCQGTQVTFTALPTGYTTYNFFIDYSLSQSNAGNTFNTSALGTSRR